MVGQSECHAPSLGSPCCGCAEAGYRSRKASTSARMLSLRLSPRRAAGVRSARESAAMSDVGGSGGAGRPGGGEDAPPRSRGNHASVVAVRSAGPVCLSIGVPPPSRSHLPCAES
jgi:hypothetical protein